MKFKKQLLFNTIIANGEYPSSWATGIIHPVHKKADHNVPDNYRKVTCYLQTTLSFFQILLVDCKNN